MPGRGVLLTLPGDVAWRHLEAMAHELGVRPALLGRLARDLAARLPTALAAARRQFDPLFKPGVRTFAERLEQFVCTTTSKRAARILEA